MCPRPQPDQSNPCLPISHFLRIKFNIMLPSTLRYSKWSLSIRFPHQTLYAPLLSPIIATCSAHLILLDWSTRIMFVEVYRA